MKEKVFVPPIKIQGIKTKLVQLIKQNLSLTADSIWIEPFMGSGVVGFNVEHKKAIFADKNPHIINFYKQIQDGTITPNIVRSFLEHEGKLLENYDEEYYYIVRSRFNAEHRPLDFLFLNRACFNGMIRFNKNNDFNVPYGHKPKRFAKAYITKIVNQVAHVSDLLKSNRWEFICQSFEKTISMARKNDFIYCDPPYIGRHVDYFDSWDEALEKKLHDSLVASQANFMLSTWDHNDFRQNDYLQTVWHDCKKITQEHFYHVGALETNRNPIIEALLTNYILPKNQKELPNRHIQNSLFDLAATQ